MQFDFDLPTTIEIMRSNKSFEERLKSLKEISDNPHLEFPTKIVLFGFPILKVKSKEELLGRIEELQDLLNVELKEVD